METTKFYNRPLSVKKTLKKRLFYSIFIWTDISFTVLIRNINKHYVS
jgi:hypothetical protein